MITTRDARASMEDLQSVRRELADRADCSVGWRATMAFFIGVAIAAQAAPGVIALATCIVCFAAIGTMAFVARNRMGFFINGYRQGRTRKVAIALLAIVETIYVISLWLKIMQHIGWAPIVAGAVIVPIVFFASYRWQNAYRSEFGAVDDIRP